MENATLGLFHYRLIDRTRRSLRESLRRKKDFVPHVPGNGGDEA